MKILFVNHGPGLFTGRDYCSGKEAAHDAVFVYCEWVAMKPMH